MVAAIITKRTVPLIPQPLKIEVTEFLNLNTPTVSMRPTAIMRGLTYGLSKCFLSVIPATERKKTRIRVK